MPLGSFLDLALGVALLESSSDIAPLLLFALISCSAGHLAVFDQAKTGLFIDASADREPEEASEGMGVTCVLAQREPYSRELPVFEYPRPILKRKIVQERSRTPTRALSATKRRHLSFIHQGWLSAFVARTPFPRRYQPMFDRSVRGKILIDRGVCREVRSNTEE